jgi:hypothetical protein
VHEESLMSANELERDPPRNAVSQIVARISSALPKQAADAWIFHP